MMTYTELMSGSAETLPTHLALLRAKCEHIAATRPTPAELRVIDFLKAHSGPYSVCDGAGRQRQARDVQAGDGKYTLRTTEAVLDRLAFRGVVDGYVSNNGQPHKGHPSEERCPESFIYFE
jgi:hypothetical protein